MNIEDQARPPGEIRGAKFNHGNRSGKIQIAIKLKGRKEDGQFWALETNLRALTATVKRAVKHTEDVALEEIEHPVLNGPNKHQSGLTFVHAEVL